MKLLLNLVLGLLVLTACKKDPPVPAPAPDPCDDTSYECDLDTLNILWIDTLTDRPLRTIPIIKAGNSIIHSYGYLVGNVPPVLQSRNIYSGEVEWESEPIPENLSGRETESFSNSHAVFINAGGTHHYAIDLSNGQELWSFNMEYGASTSFLIGDFYITSKHYASYSDSVDVLVCDALTGQCDLAFRKYARDGRGVHGRAHSAYINASGDLILIIGINSYKHPDYRRFDLKCYNYTQDSLVWEVLAVGQDGGYLASGALIHSGYPKIDLENNRVYVMTARKLYCYDIGNGQEVWHAYFAYDTTPSLSNYILHGDKVVWVDTYGHAMAVNKHTGMIIYREDLNDGNFFGRIEVWGNRCIVAENRLQLMDLNTGKILRKGWLPYHGPIKKYSSPLIDEASNRMYFTDGYAIICVEIPAKWKE